MHLLCNYCGTTLFSSPPRGFSVLFINFCPQGCEGNLLWAKYSEYFVPITLTWFFRDVSLSYLHIFKIIFIYVCFLFSWWIWRFLLMLILMLDCQGGQLTPYRLSPWVDNFNIVNFSWNTWTGHMIHDSLVSWNLVLQ